MLESLTPSVPPAPSAGPRDTALWQAAQGLEGAFLSEMLKASGLGAARTGFGGGAGEAQFGSFLRDLQVEQMVDSGGVGMAEMIYDALVARTGA